MKTKDQLKVEFYVNYCKLLLDTMIENLAIVASENEALKARIAELEKEKSGA